MGRGVPALLLVTACEIYAGSMLVNTVVIIVCWSKVPLLIIAEKQKQPKCPSTNEWILKM